MDQDPEICTRGNSMLGLLQLRSGPPDARAAAEKTLCADAHLAMFFRFRRPFLAPPDSSSGFDVTRSILDMILIQGISKLTMADIADNTPLL